jgi:hypothetical protein
MSELKPMPFDRGLALQCWGKVALKKQGTGVDYELYDAVESFFDADRNRQFRGMCFEVFGHESKLENWIWYVPWEPRYRSCIRQGWGWVTNPNNPLPEVWNAFVDAISGFDLPATRLEPNQAVPHEEGE